MAGCGGGLNLEEAEKYYSEAVSIPLFSKMTDMEVEKVTQALSNVLMRK